MKRLTFLVVIAAVGFLFTPDPVIGDPAGPPNGLNVNVVNPVENPVPVQIIEEEKPTPFQGVMSWNREGSSDPVITPLSPTPPPGMILTIEFISGRCQVGEKALDFAPRVRTSFDGNEYPNYLIPVLVNTITNTSNRSLQYVFSQKTVIFADTDDPIEPSVSYSFLGGDWPSIYCTFYVSGHLKNSQ